MWLIAAEDLDADAGVDGVGDGGGDEGGEEAVYIEIGAEFEDERWNGSGDGEVNFWNVEERLRRSDDNAVA